MPRSTVISRHETGVNSIRLIGNATLALAISYAQINSVFNPSTDSYWLKFWLNLLHNGSPTDYNYAISIYSQTDNNPDDISGTGTGANVLTSKITDGAISSFIGGVTRSSNFVPKANIWNMISVSYDKQNATIKIYIDKKLFATYTGVSAPASCVGVYRFGANRGKVRSMDGYVALPEFGYGHVLTQEEVNSMYESNNSVSLSKEYLFKPGSVGDLEIKSKTNNGKVMTFFNGAGISNQSMLHPTRVSATNRQQASNRAIAA